MPLKNSTKTHVNCHLHNAGVYFKSLSKKLDVAKSFDDLAEALRDLSAATKALGTALEKIADEE